MLSAMLALSLCTAHAGKAVVRSPERKAVEHILDVQGLPRDRALLVTHNQSRTDYVTVIRADGKHSLAGWFPVTRHSLSSPRLMVVPAKELDAWLTQVETVVTTFDVKEREWLRAAETARGPQPRLEVELPEERVDCGEGLRIQRRVPSYWPDVYLEQVQVIEATDVACSVQRIAPEVPWRLAGLGWGQLGTIATTFAAGVLLLMASLWRARHTRKRSTARKKQKPAVKSGKRRGPRGRS